VGAAAKCASLHEVSVATLKGLDNVGEFLNSHLWFQLLLWCGSFMQARPTQQEPVLAYIAGLHFDGKIRRALLSRRNTLKFFKATGASGKPVEVVAVKDLPAEAVPFKLLDADNVDKTLDFVESVLRKLERLKAISLHVHFQVGTVAFEYVVDGVAFRADNALVQACMAEKVRQLMVNV
jgi:hypothetical protein